MCQQCHYIEPKPLFLHIPKSSLVVNKQSFFFLRTFADVQDTVAAVVNPVPATGLPVLPSNAVTSLLSYLHAHPELRTALINFLSAESTKQFLATITELSLKIDSAKADGLVCLSCSHT